MKKFLTAMIFAKDAKTTLIVALAIVSFVVLGCSGSGEKSKNKPVTPEYYGSWSTNDGTTLKITSDGIGDYKSGGTSVQGAAAELDETGKVLKLSFLGVAVKEFQINQEPKNGGMKLDGVLYYTDEGKRSGPPKNGGDDEPTKGGSAELPSSSAMNDMVQEMVLALNTAVQDDDFDTFREQYGSTQFIEQVSSAKLEQEFSEFTQKKAIFNDILTSVDGLTPSYSPAPSVTEQSGYKLLNAAGKYETTPQTTFDLQYVWQGGDWKLLKMKIKVAKSK